MGTPYYQGTGAAQQPCIRPPRSMGLEVEMKLKQEELKLKQEETPQTDSGMASEEEDLEVLSPDDDEAESVEMEIVWGNVAKFVVLHALALYSVVLLPSISLASWVFLLTTYIFSGWGITAGAHRLWAHRSYKAKLPLRLLLIAANSMAGQNSVYTWARDHRLHHKASETQADPHNSKRGFFFSHMGWLCVKKHPAVMKQGKTIDMSDLEADPALMFQHRHYLPCFLLASFLLPTVLPNLLWGESLLNAYFMAVNKYVGVLHFTWLVNSAAHMFGMRPYDKNIGPAENRLVALLALGEGWHNYPHTFPYDYSTSEWGFRINLTTVFIDTMAWLGQAYNLRRASPATIEARAARTGHPQLTRGGVEAKKAH